MNNNDQMVSNFRKGKNQPEVINIASGTKGVGKTILGVNLSILYKQKGNRVLLINADTNNSNFENITQIDSKNTLIDVISGKKDISEIISKGPGEIDVLSASFAVSEIVEDENRVIPRLADSFHRLFHNYDKIIVDSDVGIYHSIISLVLIPQKIALLVTPDPNSIAEAYSLVKVFHHNNENTPVMLISNMVKNQDEGDSIYQKMNLMVQRFLDSRLQYGGYIVNDEIVNQPILQNTPIALTDFDSVALGNMKLIANRLQNLKGNFEKIENTRFERLKMFKRISIGGF